MNREEFIKAVFEFFRVKDETGSLFRSYDIALSKGRDIDWNKLYIITLENVKDRFIPMPGFFIEHFNNCRIEKYEHSKINGKLIRVFFKSGRYSDFTICGFGQSMEELKTNSEKSDPITEIRMYPKYVKGKSKDGRIEQIPVALVGVKVFPENTLYEIFYTRA